MTDIEKTDIGDSAIDKTGNRTRRQLIAGGAALAAGGLMVATSASPAAATEHAAGYVPAADPYRTYDSRNDADAPILAGETYIVDMSGIPAESVAVMVNLTVVHTTGSGGYLTAYGQGRSRPGVSTINWFGPDQTLANMVTLPTGVSDNDLAVFCGASSTHFIVDVYGWYL